MELVGKEFIDCEIRAAIEGSDNRPLSGGNVADAFWPPPVEHRSKETSRHLLLSRANFSISFQVKPALVAFLYNMTSGQCMPMMDRRHLLTKDCSLLEVAFVTLHVSDPYKRTDLTLVLNIRFFGLSGDCFRFPHGK